MFVGLALAGLYIYLKDTVLPNKKIDILATPMFLKKICIGRRRERKEEDEDEEQERRDR